MTYPDGIDALVNVNANDTLAAGGHAARHNSVNTALVEVKDYLVGALGSKLPYAFGTATPTTTESGFLWYDSTGAPSKPTPKFWDGSAFVPLGGKILQIVRATDSTDRSTTSTSFVDASISVTITPQKSDSVVLLIWSAMVNKNRDSNDNRGVLQVTDNSNNPISGANESVFGHFGPSLAVTWYSQMTLIGYATPGTTSATTYKGRFQVIGGGTLIITNSEQTGQLYAIEVSA
jgi:hypothetical protein